MSNVILDISERVRLHQRRDVIRTKLRLLHDDAVTTEDVFAAVQRAIPDVAVAEIEQAAGDIKREIRWLGFTIKLGLVTSFKIARISIVASILFGAFWWIGTRS